MRSRGLYGSYTKPGLIMTTFIPTCTNEINITTLNMILFQVEKTTEVNQNVLTPSGHQEAPSTPLLLTLV
jgi:hypothetical protein